MLERNLLIIGGRDSTALTNTETLSIDEKSNKWLTGPELPEPRQAMTSAVFADGSVCVYGGLNTELGGVCILFEATVCI